MNAEQKDTLRNSGQAQDRTPSSDLQPEDTGTPASGNSGRGTAAEAAMKQFQKTDAETGSGGGGQ